MSRADRGDGIRTCRWCGLPFAGNVKVRGCCPGACDEHRALDRGEADLVGLPSSTEEWAALAAAVDRHPAGYVTRGESLRARTRRRRAAPQTLSDAVESGVLESTRAWCVSVRPNPAYL